MNSNEMPHPNDLINNPYPVRVLLIDDQLMVAEALRRSLADQKDIEFHYESDPTRAIARIREIKPTCILQDLVMPNTDGLDLVRQYREDKEISLIPVIVLSTREEAEIKSRAFTLGANDYLVKLPNRIELIARLRYHSRAYIIQKQRDEAYLALQQSQQQLAAANEALKKLSTLDGLTGIPNRRRFDESLKQEWQRARRYCSSLSLIMVDIDFFKPYNDHYGHHGGDLCLKRVANILKASVCRETDLVARYGGEEFAVILSETGIHGATEVADHMRSNIESAAIPHEKSKISEWVTISLGVASAIPEITQDPTALIKAADQALYQAKQNGRNTVVSFFEVVLR